MATGIRENSELTFSHAINGYARAEVDAFIKQSALLAERQKNTISKLKAEIAQLKNSPPPAPQQALDKEQAIDAALRERDQYRLVSEQLARELYEIRSRMGNGEPRPPASPRPNSEAEVAEKQEPVQRETIAAYRSYFQMGTKGRLGGS